MKAYMELSASPKKETSKRLLRLKEVRCSLPSRPVGSHREIANYRPQTSVRTKREFARFLLNHLYFTEFRLVTGRAGSSRKKTSLKL